ncbi:TonB-dependent receptor [Desulfuromonas sp. AOP6]|uniref:TonB-dependent receptor plug domain-containing protein n=1 Tax=Desulfuromonas sp. AOP6 TaxID=1566351 RepID=UPI001272203B|nr:TonB-dependent receptor [Desulfuromonas sp. AOP6]BCA80755.1 TonB-dependent receptor [Desulfuromonas sp. AOP6]
MKKHLLACLTLTLLLLPAGTPLAQPTEMETVVVTATKVETAAEEVASAITVITAEEMEEKQQRTVLDALRAVPALNVTRRGGPGQQTSIFLRGAEARHTLVLIDGVEMNDPIDPGRAFNFAHLSTDNIERIEVVRGPQSTLYGSDAMGGVINIITRRGAGKPSGYVSAEAGSYRTFEERAGLRGGNELVNFSLGVSRLDSDGISVADEKDGNREEDGYENTSVSTRLGLTPTDHLEIEAIARYQDSQTDIDNGGGIGADDPNHVLDSTEIFFRTQARLLLFDELWEQTLGFSRTRHERDDNNDPDATHPLDLLRSSYKGSLTKFDWQHNLYLHETNTLTLGLETEKEKGRSSYVSDGVWGPYEDHLSEQTARTNGYYLQDQIRLQDAFFVTLGVRLDDHSRFGTETTWRTAAAYLFKTSGTKIKGTYGTGFKAPSLFQLYSSYGDINMKAEKSQGWDVGIEQSLWEQKLTLGATYFRNTFDDLIDYDYVSWSYKNIGEATSDGVELTLGLDPVEALSLQASYTFTDTENKITGEDLLLRPRHKADLSIGYQYSRKGQLNVHGTYVGKRDDYGSVTLPSYTLVNLATSYDITPNIQVFGRIDNLFDKSYQEVAGYGTPGLSGYAGVTLSF